MNKMSLFVNSITIINERVDFMTPKELLYLEDSLGMERQLQTKCSDYSAKVQNPQLKNMLSGLAQEHQTHFDNLINHL